MCQGDSGAPLWTNFCEETEQSGSEGELYEEQPQSSKGEPTKRKRKSTKQICKRRKIEGKMGKYTIMAVFSSDYVICGIASSWAVKVGEENVMNWINENMIP